LQPATTEVPAPSSVWWARITRRGNDLVEHSLVAVNSDRYPAGTAVTLGGLDPLGRRPGGWLVDVRYRAAGRTVVGIDVAGRVAEPRLPLWFAEVHHFSSGLPAVSLVAFTGDTFGPGSLVRPHEVAARGVRMRDRVGEVRWYTRSGLVDTVTVHPQLRGRGIGRLLAVAAEGLSALCGWPPLTGDGRLTDTAAAWLAASPAYWRPRLAARTHHVPEDHPDRSTWSPCAADWR
jgi:GNAT superfamily N-acetyltransferase